SASDAFNKFLSTMETVVRELSQHTQTLTASASALTASAKNLKESTHEQESEAHTMAASITEMQTAFSNAAGLAEQAQVVSLQAGQQASDGIVIIRSATSHMEEIDTNVRRAAVTIGNLQKNSDQISAIVQVIQSIADQTNLLALNAAIEAARAGDQGRGFSVVADEVRTLAARTAQSTQEITQMISSIQSSTVDAVKRMEDALKSVEDGVSQAHKAVTAIDEIQAGAKKSSEVVSDISHALAEQARTTQNMSTHVDRLYGLTESNSRASEQAAEETERLSRLAGHIKQSLSRFSLR
ncbi:MAG TPA: methyl-accepting chemotaxis protein, partial [Pseudomonadales bacterium]|nr:methyl-accepting chemotaxis protein [Pseudomonadales bacterium]